LRTSERTCKSERHQWYAEHGGYEGWREAFEVFVKSLDEEYRKYPEIADVELAPIVWIVGAGRSGTAAQRPCRIYWRRTPATAP
jgi:hypothetical protein